MTELDFSPTTLIAADRAALGVLLAERRKALGITQRDLERVSGVPQGKISRIERCQSYPALVTLTQIVEGLGLTMHLRIAVPSEAPRM